MRRFMLRHTEKQIFVIVGGALGVEKHCSCPQGIARRRCVKGSIHRIRRSEERRVGEEW